MGYENDLANLGVLSGGAQGFIKGIQDAEDHSMRLEDQKMRKMELDAKLRSQDQEREQQRELKARDEAIRKRTQLIELKKSGYAIEPGMDADTVDIGSLQRDPKWVQEQIQIAGAKASAAEGAKPPTDVQNVAGGFAKRMEEAHNGFLGMKDFDPTSFSSQVQGALPDALEGIKGQGVKLYEAYKRNFISANLRKESGAAIGKDEYALEDKKYFPQPGDGPQLIAAKEQLRAQAIENMKANSGKAYARIPTAPTPRAKGKLKSGLVNEGKIAAPAQSKPKTVIQNGVTYTLNPQTGEYE